MSHIIHPICIYILQGEYKKSDLRPVCDRQVWATTELHPNTAFVIVLGAFTNIYIHYIHFTGFYSLSNMSLFYHTLVLLEIVFLFNLIQENAISVWFKFGLLLVWIIFYVLNCHLNFHFDKPFLIILCSISC